jgi:hypothetical protein
MLFKCRLQTSKRRENGVMSRERRRDVVAATVRAVREKRSISYASDQIVMLPMNTTHQDKSGSVRAEPAAPSMRSPCIPMTSSLFYRPRQAGMVCLEICLCDAALRRGRPHNRY